MPQVSTLAIRDLVTLESAMQGFGFPALAPLGERVARRRRFHQPGREGGPTFCSSWG
jgi:hypothetical protein